MLFQRQSGRPATPLGFLCFLVYSLLQHCLQIFDEYLLTYKSFFLCCQQRNNFIFASRQRKADEIEFRICAVMV
ncbi:hypothetical protein F4776DRAFT_614297 [Hypoxylon sp. NC0597]|nr:hypothetical protein F4776DRAFT_614297 [Hypoxylon sp. NC0597]